MQKNTIFNSHLIILSIVIIFHLLNNIYFLNVDNEPLVWDNYNYHTIYVNNYNSFKSGNVYSLVNHFITPKNINIVLTPVYFLYPLFGTSQDVTAFQGTFFLLILIISTYLLGKELYNDDVGLLAAIFVSFSPFILATSKVPFEDINFSAMLILTIYFFIKSNNFSEIKYTLLFNFSLLITLLSKNTSIFVLFFIFIIYFLLKLIFERYTFRNFFFNFDKRQTIIFFVSFSISIFLFLLFFLNRNPLHFKEGLIHISPFSVSMYNIHFLNNLVYTKSLFINNFILNSEYFFIFIIFLISFSLLLFKEKENGKKIIIFSLLLGGNICNFIVLYFNKYSFDHIQRYSLFLKPIYFLIISLFFMVYLYNFLSFRLSFNFFFKKIYFIVLPVFFLIFFAYFNLNYNYDSHNYKYQLSHLFGKMHPLRSEYKLPLVLNNIASSVNPLNIFLFGFSDGKFADSFSTFIVFNNSHINLTRFILGPYENTIIDYNNFLNYSVYIEVVNFNLSMLDSYDYVFIIKQTSPANPFFSNFSYMTDFFNASSDFILYDEISINEYECNSSILIYKNRIKNEI